MPELNPSSSFATDRLGSASETDSASQSARNRERAKTPLKKAKDWIYVWNHTVTCLFFDTVGQLPVLAWLSNKGTKSGNLKAFFKSLRNWGEAELVGDLGAVVPTVITQRFAPGTMEKVNDGLCVVLGPAYHWGAEHSSKRWAAEHGIGQDTPEYRDHVEKLYREETGHLSQALEWTALSTAGNVLWMKYKLKEEEPLLSLTGNKLKAAALATGVVIGNRAVWPGAAQRRDSFLGNIFVPKTDRERSAAGMVMAPVDDEIAVPGTRITDPLPVKEKGRIGGNQGNDNFEVANDRGRWGKTQKDDAPVRVIR